MITPTPVSCQPPPGSSFFYRDYKNKARNPDVDTARLAESRFVVPFNINNMHSGQLKHLLSRDKLASAIGNPAAVADFLADIVATSKEDSFHDPEMRVTSNIDMYKAALHEHGFNNTDWQKLTDSVKETLGTSGHVVWIIAGCQGKVLVKRRATAAAIAFSQVEAAIPNLTHHIIYCGAHPPVDRVDLPNEANLLGEGFRATLREISPPLSKRLEDGDPNWHQIFESKSTTTAENIRLSYAEVINKVNSEQKESTPYVAMIISNDFHLIRLSRDFRNFRRTQSIVCVNSSGSEEDMAVKACERQKGLTFSGLFLLGSEFFSSAETTKALDEASDRAAFTKRIYFEVLSDFFRRNYFLPDAPFLRNQNPDDYKPSDNDVIALDEGLDSLIVPGLDKNSIVTFGFRLNRLVFHPVTPESLLPAVEAAIMKKSVEAIVNVDKSEDPTLRSLRIIHRLGGRFTQPTVRVAGEPKLTLESDGRWRTRIDLARNYEGASLGAQTGVLEELAPAIAETLRGHQLISLHVSVLYLCHRNGQENIILRKRSANRYVYAGKVEASIEGPIYIVDFEDREHLNLAKPVLRLFKKEFLHEWSKNSERVEKLIRWSRGKDWSDDFRCVGYSQSATHRHSCIHGLLRGPEFPLPSFSLPNDLVDDVVYVPFTATGIEEALQSFGTGGQAIVPSSFATLLLCLKWLKSSEFPIVREMLSEWVAQPAYVR